MVGEHTYETDLPLQVRDCVVLPTASWLVDVKGPTWEGKVTSLESDYDGPCLKVMGMAKESPKKDVPEPYIPERHTVGKSWRKYHYVVRIEPLEDDWDVRVYACGKSAKTGGFHSGEDLKKLVAYCEPWCPECRKHVEGLEK
jgi:hypothetical protein